MKASVPCQSCHKEIALRSPSFVAYLLVLFPITLSGHVEHYSVKVLLWLSGAAAFLLVCTLYVALQPKESGAKTTPPPLMVVWLCIAAIGCIAGININFFPSAQLSLFALCAAVLAALPMVHYAWRKVPRGDEKLLAFGAGFIFLTFTHFLFFAVTLPVGPARWLGDERITQTKILYKSASHKVLSCSKSVELSDFRFFLKRKICVLESDWGQFAVGDTVSVVTVDSWLGRYIKRIS